MLIRRIQTGEWGIYRQLRLAALLESPRAFSTTYEDALARTEESWREQADSAARGGDRCSFLAFTEQGFPVGLASAYRDGRKPDEAELLQVWVSPNLRGSGLARSLVKAALAWCGDRGIWRVTAIVVEGNDRALAFYGRLGFAECEDESERLEGARVLAISLASGGEPGR
ncbi:MAG TPA: GNAT family N-acetyltransferase [Rectinemataceae bacterium]|nr:GNAT family N-acetyltransferase [Rectinemataceae bacterium]